MQSSDYKSIHLVAAVSAAICLVWGALQPRLAAQEDSARSAESADGNSAQTDSESASKEKKQSKSSTDDSEKASQNEPADGESEKSSKTDEQSGKMKRAKGGEAEKKSDGDPDTSRFERAYSKYIHAAKDYVETTDSVIDAEYQKQIATIRKRYDKKLDESKAAERQHRKNAIQKLKAFLERNPNLPKYTPDAMFRLAELYFERSTVQYQRAQTEYKKQLEKYRKGKRADRPPAPERDYSQSMEIFEKLVAQWPDYEQIAGAYYLLAISHHQMGNPEKAKNLFSKLVDKHPDSSFTAEAWLRIGEYYFQYGTSSKALQKAKDAYSEAAKYEEGKFYDKALYKLAWTNYRLGDYPAAIADFKTLVRFSDRQKRETGKSGSVLRSEAIQYIAVSLTLQDWNEDGQTDASFGMQRFRKYLPGKKPYEYDVLTRLAEMLHEEDLYDHQIDVLRYALNRYPKHQNNPGLHKKLILALTRNGDKKEAFEARQATSERFGEGTAWYKHQKQKGREDALDTARKLIRKELVSSAKWFHQRAQKLRTKVDGSPGNQQEARRLYRKAARGYQSFLKKYPNVEEAYKLNYRYADALFYAGEYEQAYRQYRVVRELDIPDFQYREESAFKAVKALEKHLVQLRTRGEVPGWVQLEDRLKSVRQTAQKQGSASKNAAQKGRDQQKKAGDTDQDECKQITKWIHRYITAMDRYVVLRLDNSNAPDRNLRLAFQSGKVFYDGKCYEPARERFEWLVEHFPDNNFAFLGGSLILEMYRRQEKYNKLAEWAKKLDDVIKGEQAAAIKKEVQQFKLGAMFKSARKLHDEQKFEKAAKEYLRLVNSNPDHKFAAKALNNAAVAYENINKYESAMELYDRVYREYSDNPLSYYALYRVAVNSERFFDFDRAIEAYLEFYRTFEDKEVPEKLEKMDFDVPAKQTSALRSAAVLSENLQQYRKAAKLYEEFVQKYPTEKDTDQVQWKAVESWKKAKKPDKMIEAIRTYNDRFGSAPDNAAQMLEGLTMIAEHYKKQGKMDDATETYKQIIQTFEDRNLEPKSESAYYAAKAQFEISERKYAEWQKIELSGSPEQQKQKLKQKVKGSQQISKSYSKVFKYKNLEWTLAAGYRMGSLFQNFADTLYNAPVPFEKGSERYKIYQRKLEEKAIPIEDKAVSHFERTIKKARQNNIVNEWTKKTLESLNEYRPSKYPLYKEARKAPEMSVRAGLPLETKEPEPESGAESGQSQSGDSTEQVGGKDDRDQ